MKYKREFLAEFGGTALMVFFGVGSVQAATLAGAQVGLWQVAVVWGVAVALAIYAFGMGSGAHINPAVTIAMACLRGFSWRKVPVYLLAQFLGAVAAAAFLYLQFRGAILHFEEARELVRGAPGSELAAMVFGEYFPHPGVQNALGWAPGVVGEPLAMLAEFVGTGILAAMVFALTDRHNKGGAGPYLTPAFIGLTVAAVISILAPITQAGLNPARDFGPRVVAFLAGWGTVAIPGPSGGFFTVYILSPCLGAITGGFFYGVMTRYDLRAENEEKEEIMSGGSPAPRVIIVGGFLGAGKSTLLRAARTLLEAGGHRVGVVTNDQAPGLVDTEFLAGGGPGVEEVAGSCFCCNFPAFEGALARLASRGADVILAEPVGSCADLSATIMQPLKELHRADFKPAPFTVLLDPGRAGEILGRKPATLHPDAFYILGRQLEEADRILLTKTDLLAPDAREALEKELAEAFPEALVSSLSAKSGDGVKLWLDDQLAASGGAGRKLVTVDYERYANGEAVLGWVNLKASPPFAARGDAKTLALFLGKLDDALKGGRIGHVKVLWPSPGGLFMGNLTGGDKDPVVTALEPDDNRRGPVLVNARVECPPSRLEDLIRTALAETLSENQEGLAVSEVHSLIPGYPKPTHRYLKVVAG
ncbi:MAG: aquaporin [Deltaproteobacteria bacterium]|jgi:MIP family channel proteins|nr:aquaporin [Deltaproteobacteria bacterium]